MKKLLIKIVSLILATVSLFALTACGSGEGGGEGSKGEYKYQRVSATYLASAPTCTTPAKYYYSNKAGDKGTETFSIGAGVCNFVDNKCSICGADEVYTQGLRFTEQDTFVICNGFNQDAEIVENVVIPQKYNNKPVTKIGYGAFEGKKIKSVTLPYYMEVVLGNSFKNCSQLGMITFPIHVKEINGTAFTGCGALEYAIFENPHLWYRNKFVKTPDLDECNTAASMQKKSDLAKTLYKSDGTYSYFRVV